MKNVLSPWALNHVTIVVKYRKYLIIPPAYEVFHGGIMFSSFLCVCVCVRVCVSVSNFRVRSITLKPLDIFHETSHKR